MSSPTSAWIACGDDVNVSAPLSALRPMCLTDVDAVALIEASVYPHPWTLGNFIDSLAAGYVAEMLLDGQGQTLGYLLGLYGHQETHLLNLTVTPAAQRQGHGRTLLARLTALAQLRGDALLWLEVRQSNAPALALYRSAGFEAVGLRRAYYPAGASGREDAVVMRLKLGRGDGLD